MEVRTVRETGMDYRMRGVDVLPKWFKDAIKNPEQVFLIVEANLGVGHPALQFDVDFFRVIDHNITYIIINH